MTDMLDVVKLALEPAKEKPLSASRKKAKTLPKKSIKPAAMGKKKRPVRKSAIS